MNEYPMHTLSWARYSLALAHIKNDPRLEEIKARIFKRWPKLKAEYDKKRSKGN